MRKIIAVILCLVFCFGTLTFSEEMPGRQINAILISEDFDIGMDTGSGSGSTGSTPQNIVPGDIVLFGRYPQTKGGTDLTQIEWIVLEVRGNRLLLLSRYGLDAKPYKTRNRSVTWETSSIRTWLNETFFFHAFTSGEQNIILPTTIDNSEDQGNRDWTTVTGNNTQDRVFLLSYAEAEKYFISDYGRACVPTDYAIKQGAWRSASFKIDGRGAGAWWLRSPGASSGHAAIVSAKGELGTYSVVTYTSNIIRPALWVQLNT